MTFKRAIFIMSIFMRLDNKIMLKKSYFTTLLRMITIPTNTTVTSFVNTILQHLLIGQQEKKIAFRMFKHSVYFGLDANFFAYNISQ